MPNKYVPDPSKFRTCLNTVPVPALMLEGIRVVKVANVSLWYNLVSSRLMWRYILVFILIFIMVLVLVLILLIAPYWLNQSISHPIICRILCLFTIWFILRKRTILIIYDENYHSFVKSNNRAWTRKQNTLCNKTKFEYTYPQLNYKRK